MPDLWGKIRRTVEGDVASAQASAGDLASARLSAQGTLASDYLQLRVADELKRLLEAEVKAFTESLRITRNQYQSGTADQSAVSQAETQLEGTQAQADRSRRDPCPARTFDRGTDWQAAGRSDDRAGRYR